MEAKWKWVLVMTTTLSVLTLFGITITLIAFAVLVTGDRPAGAVVVDAEYHGFSAYWPPREDEPMSFRLTSWEDTMGGTYAVMWGATYESPSEEGETFSERFLESISDAPPDIVKLFPPKVRQALTEFRERRRQ